MTTGQKIQALRKQRGLTQEQLAQRLGVSAPAVNKWERNNSYPDITLLPPLARLLEVDLNTLLSFQGKTDRGGDRSICQCAGGESPAGGL